MNCSLHDKDNLCVSIVPIFNSLTIDEQLEVSKLAKTKRYKKNEYLFNASEYNNNLYIIHKGLVKLSRYNIDGDEQILHILKPGDFIGESSFLSNKKTNNFAIVLEDSDICVLNGIEFKKHLKEKPEILFKIIEEISSRLYDAENNIEQRNLLPTNKRIINDILSYKTKVINLPFSKKEWSNILGMSNETLSRNLKILKEENIIDLKGHRTIIIKSIEKLEDKLYE